MDDAFLLAIYLDDDACLVDDAVILAIYLDDDAYLVDDDVTLTVYLDDDAFFLPPPYLPFSTPIKEMRAPHWIPVPETPHPQDRSRRSPLQSNTFHCPTDPP